MKPKTQKKQELKKLEEKLPLGITVFTSFAKAGEKGLSVAKLSELKKALRALHAEYFVTKKTLMDIALKKNPAADGADVYKMSGSVGLILGGDDPYAVSKKAYEFSKKNPELKFWGALFEGKFIGIDQFLEIAKLPSREQLIARLLGMMKYPLSSLAIVLNEIGKKKSATV